MPIIFIFYPTLYSHLNIFSSLFFLFVIQLCYQLSSMKMILLLCSLSKGVKGIMSMSLEMGMGFVMSQSEQSLIGLSADVGIIMGCHYIRLEEEESRFLFIGNLVFS